MFIFVCSVRPQRGGNRVRFEGSRAWDRAIDCHAHGGGVAHARSPADRPLGSAATRPRRASGILSLQFKQDLRRLYFSHLSLSVYVGYPLFIFFFFFIFLSVY